MGANNAVSGLKGWQVTDRKPEGTPNPGSDEAIERGCTCAVLDNGHGQGFPYGGETCFWITQGCPIHAKIDSTVVKDATKDESGN